MTDYDNDPGGAKPRKNMRNRDLLALRRYITGADTRQHENVDPALVIIDLTHSNLIQQHIEIRFAKHDTLEHLRTIIHRKTGTPPCWQHLQVKDNVGGDVLVEIPPNDLELDRKPLGYFGILEHGMQIHCIDLNPHSASARGGYEDVRLVEKYVMSEADYAARKGTLRDWAATQKAKNADFDLRKHAQQHRELAEAKRCQKLGLALPAGFFVDSSGEVVRDEPDVVAATCPTATTINTDSAVPEENAEFGAASVAHVQLQVRCEIQPGARRGVVHFVGVVPELPSGYWVGVCLDEPVGHNDGVAGTTHYFDTPGSRYGSWVRGKNVHCGDDDDYPERDLLDDDDDHLQDSSDDEL